MPILIRRYSSESFSSKQATRTTSWRIYVRDPNLESPTESLDSIPVSCNKQSCSRLHEYRILNKPRLEVHLERNHRHEPWGFSVTTVELGTGGRGATCDFPSGQLLTRRGRTKFVLLYLWLRLSTPVKPASPGSSRAFGSGFYQTSRQGSFAPAQPSVTSNAREQ